MMEFVNTRWRPIAAVTTAVVLVYVLLLGDTSSAVALRPSAVGVAPEIKPVVRVMPPPPPPPPAPAAAPPAAPAAPGTPASPPDFKPDCALTPAFPPPGGSCVDSLVVGPHGSLIVCAPAPEKVHGASPMDLVKYYNWVPKFWESQPKESWGLDVGANIGTTAFVPAWLGHTIIGFEPVPVNHQILGATLCANAAAGKSAGLAGLHLVPAAVGDKPGSLDLWVPQNYGDNAAVNAEAAGGNLGKVVPADKITVPVVTVDGWLAGHPELKLDPCAAALMKVDVQGYELRVLQGAVSFLTAARGSVTVRAEDDMHLTALALGKEAVGGVGALMRGLGYVEREVTSEKDVIWVSDGKGDVPCPRRK